MNILVTNDDGIGRSSHVGLARELSKIGNVLLAVPSRDQSGSACDFGSRDPATSVAVTPMESAGTDGAWVVDGTPAYIVLAAMLGAFGARPDLIVSGVNFGTNVGRHILYSGTVGSCLVAQKFGVPGIAVSQARSEPWCTSVANRAAASVARHVISGRRRTVPTVVNVNVPSRGRSGPRGVRVATLADFKSVSLISTAGSYRTTRRPLDAVAEDSDEYLVRAGYMTITGLNGYLQDSAHLGGLDSLAADMEAVISA